MRNIIYSVLLSLITLNLNAQTLTEVTPNPNDSRVITTGVPFLLIACHQFFNLRYCFRYRPREISTAFFSDLEGGRVAVVNNQIIPTIIPGENIFFKEDKTVIAKVQRRFI